MSLTEQIYAELVDGLKTGSLDWTAFTAKHGASKGPLYNAVGRFIRDMEPKVRELGGVQAELDAAGLKLDQAGLTLNSLDQKIKEVKSNLAPLEERKSTLNEEIGTLETKLAEKSELMKQVRELEKHGFDIERLRQLREALTEIGAKNGLKGKEAVSKFFDDLKDYEAVLEAKALLEGLRTQIETKKLQAENWQAKEETLRRKHDDRTEAIDAMQALLKRGVKAEQIVSWSGIVSKLGGPEELQDKLERYKSMSELLNAKKTEIENCDKKVIEVGAQIKALNEQKVEIEGAIKSLSTSGVKKITEVSDKAVTGLKSLSTSGLKEVTKVSSQAIAELKSLLAEIRVETERLSNLKAEAGKLEKELMYARYLTTGDQAVLKSFPKEVVIAFLDRAFEYCKLNQLNPRVKALDGFGRKYVGIESYAELELIDLITWAEAGLAGAVQ
ncbi:hypothetical protein ES703_110414 [subsurface metagenome]